MLPVGVQWGPATLVTGNFHDELMTLKQQPGKNIQIPGSPRLVRSLLIEGLLDELTLNICPIVVGPGLRLFDDVTDQVALAVVRSMTLSNGVIGVTYRPASAHEASAEPTTVTFPEPEKVAIALSSGD